MYKIDKVKSFNKVEEINGILEERERIFILKRDIKEKFFYINQYMNKGKIEVIDEKNTKITLYNLRLKYKTEKEIIFEVGLIIVGIHRIEELRKISYIRVKMNFDNRQVLFNKYMKFKLKKGKSVCIKNNYIIISNCNLKESDATNIILNIIQLLALIIGEFPEIDYFSFRSKCNNLKVKKYFELKGYSITSYDNCSYNKKLVETFKLKGNEFSKIYKNYKNIILGDDVQLKTFFISQSSTQYYSDYRFSYLIQSIEGFSKKYYSEEIKNVKLKKQYSIEDIKNPKKEFEKALEDIERFIDNNDYSKQTVNKIKEWLKNKDNNIGFKDVFWYWMEDSFIKDIFNFELSVNKECKEYFNIKKLIDICSNERNRIVHTTKKQEKKRYFNDFERNIYFRKFTLMFRYIVLKKVGVRLEKRILEMNVYDYNNKENKLKCENCSKKCIIKGY